MEVFGSISAVVSAGRLLLGLMGMRNQKRLCDDDRSPNQLDKIVGEVSKREGSSAGKYIIYLNEVFHKAPKSIRMFILALEGKPSARDKVARVDTIRGYVRGLLKKIDFYYEGSKRISGIIVYSRTSVQGCKVNISSGGIGHKSVNVNINIGHIANSYKDIQIIVLTEKKRKSQSQFMER